MANADLATYLNDHMAGAHAALDLLDQLASSHAGTPIENLARGLHADIEADRAELETLMGRLEIDQSKVRAGIGWLGSQLAQIKLRLADPSGGPFRLLETCEALSLGIEGKRLLWRSLRATVGHRPEAEGFDFAALEKRAVDQRGAVEAFRLGSAQGAFGSHASS